MLGVKLVIERLRVVIIDEYEGIPRRQLVHQLEYLLVALHRYQGPYVDQRWLRLCGGRHVSSPSAAG